MAREFTATLRETGGGHDDMLFNGDLYLARFVSLQGRVDEAESLFQAVLAREAEADDPRSRARLHFYYGSQLTQGGCYAQAEQSLNAAVARLKDIREGTTLANPDDVIVGFMALYQAWDKPDKLQEYQRLREESLRQAAFPN